MFYLFIFESIGTSELILIGLVALVIFGPRKLPEFAKMLGKARNEFKRTTDEFKQTWEREVDFENENRKTSEIGQSVTVNSIQRANTEAEKQIIAPNIREVSQENFQKSYTSEKEIKQEIPDLTNKRDWL